MGIRCRRVVLIAIQRAAGFEKGPGIESAREYAGSKVRRRIENVIAERVSTHPEGPRVQIEDLVADSILEGSLIIELQRAIVGPARLHRHDVAAPGGLIVGTCGCSGESTRRWRRSRGRFPHIGGGGVVVGIILVEILTVREYIADAQDRAIVERGLERHIGFFYASRRIIGGQRHHADARQQRLVEFEFTTLALLSPAMTVCGERRR